MKYDSVIFDLDGTLWDTCGSCAIAWNNVIQRHGIDFRKITSADVAGVTGKPHEECIRTVFDGLPEEHINILIKETMTEDNLMVEKYGGELYLGVKEGLLELASRFPLFIVSNCQSGYIETFLRWSGFEPLFKDFECWGNTYRPKGENIKAVIDRNGLKVPVYIGDTEGDRNGAQYCAIPFIQVTYGYAGPIEGEIQVETFDELRKKLLF